MAAAAGPSLTGRALRLLSQREHSRLELLRKLGPHAESPEQLDHVLDDLERRGFLSAQRFADSVVHRREGRFGSRRIGRELSVHRVDAAITESALQRLRATERERALTVWQKRFGRAPADRSERAKQHRFLAQRGFDADVIGWVMRYGAAADALPEAWAPQGEDGPD
jgi:regulatory protein